MSSKTGKIKIWGAQIRGSFLVLSVLLVCIGLSLSALHIEITKSGIFNPYHAILLIVGVVLTHISVNLFNEYSDYKTGIDSNTKRTPFSGGSGMIQAGLTKPKSVLFAAVTTLILALFIGIYFIIISHWSLIILMVIGGVAIVFYTTHLAKILLGELFAGMTLGTFVVLGVYISMIGNWNIPAGDLLSLDIILISIPPGLLTSLLLFLNEFPDAEADKKGGRFHIVIWLGKKKSAYIYSVVLAVIYAIIIIIPAAGLASKWILLALLTLPVAIKAASIAVKFGEDNEKLLSALGMNVMIVLITDALIAVAFLIKYIQVK
ncbi:prenyltransferase [Spirochaetota bacterium]